MQKKQQTRITKLEYFFKFVRYIKLFSNSTHRSDVLQAIVNRKLSRTITACWNYNIRRVNNVFENREQLIERFDLSTSIFHIALHIPNWNIKNILSVSQIVHSDISSNVACSAI